MSENNNTHPLVRSTHIPLLLTSTQTNAAFTNKGLISVMELLDKRSAVGFHCSFLDLVQGCIFKAIRDVISNGTSKQNRFLGYQADLFTPPASIDIFDIMVSNINISSVWIIVAQEKRSDRRLSGAGWSNHRNDYRW
jgi:hypothetical protein